jgi:dihydrofolate reductase
VIKISLIVAVAENGVIGAKGGLPWRLSSDLKTFRRLTMGKPVIMGRKTFETLKKPLDGRDNIVVTRDPAFEAAGVTALASLGEAITLARVLALTKGVDEIMVIGGEDIFRAALPLAERIYWTAVHASPAGDRYFPALDPAEWREVAVEPLPKGDRDDHAATLRILERVAGPPPEAKPHG